MGHWDGIAFILLEVTLQQTLQCLAVASLVAGHLVDGVVDGVQAVLLGADGQVGLALSGTVLAMSRRRAYGIVPAGRCSYKGGCRRKPLSTLALLETPIAGSVSTILSTFREDVKMKKLDDTGVYQLKGGNWAYRYTITENGRKKDVRKAKDEYGNPFNTKRDAIKARQVAIDKEQEGNRPQPRVRKTIAEVYAEYCENGRDSKAYTTIRKQESL